VSIEGFKKWSELTPDEQFERIAWSVATSTALETCESPQEIYRRMMVQHQERKEKGQT
jgi:hypothetical protein